jgi:nucleotide-binding universal stress UspA family protein
MISRILAPLDRSKFAESALPLAAALARGAGAALELVSVVEADPLPLRGPTVPPESNDRMRHERTAYLDGVAERIGDTAGGVVETLVLDGEASDALLNRVANADIDLVVMSTHGRGPMERAWLGSVADRLVRRLDVPVILVRPEQGGKDRPDGRGTVSSGTLDVRRLLITLDGSDLAEAVLGPATDVARALGAPVSLLRVVGVRMYPGLPHLPHGAEEYSRLLEAERTEAEDYLARVAARLAEHGVEVEGHQVLQGPTAATILGAAKAETDGLIAMTTHGRGGLQRLILGSVADKVLRASSSPVLMVRPPDRE